MVQWRMVTHVVSISSIYGNVNQREDIIPIIQKITDFSGPKIVAGDVNLRHLSWDLGAGLDPHTYVAERFAEILERHEMEVINPD